MCGRYTVIESEEEIEARFDAKSDTPFAPRYNAAPSQKLPVVIDEGEKKIELLRWGFIPSWAKDASIGYKMINARSETVDKLGSYKKPFRFQRCLVPASGFYEWLKTKEGKQPYYFQLKSGGLFAFAGLYDTWHSPEGQEIKSYTIITTNSKLNTVVAPIHDRIPVILKKEDEKLWLNPDVTEPQELLPLLHAYPASEMKSFPVSKGVNSPKLDNKDLIEPLSQ